MKMWDLVRYVEPTTTAPAWPPCRIGSFALVGPTPMPRTAVRESLTRVGVGRQLSAVSVSFNELARPESCCEPVSYPTPMQTELLPKG
jgi:hypothetical protein